MLFISENIFECPEGQQWDQSPEHQKIMHIKKKKFKSEKLNELQSYWSYR